MLGDITMLSAISTTSVIDHLKVFNLSLVGIVFSSLVHLEFRGASMESVSHVENVDTSCLIALKGNHSSQIRDPQLQNLRLAICVDPKECSQWRHILLQGKRFHGIHKMSPLVLSYMYASKSKVKSRGVDVVPTLVCIFAIIAKLF